MMRLLLIRCLCFFPLHVVVGYAETFEPVPGCRIGTVPVEPGTFTQGSASDELGRRDDETLREVTLTTPFLIGETPVTRDQFAAFVSDTGYRTEAERGKSGGFGVEGGKLVQRPGYTWKSPGFAQTGTHPVVIVTYNDAREFCRWMSRKTGRVVTLPTEARWELARRRAGGDAAIADALGWYSGNAGATTHPVGEKPAGAAISDMPSHVYEWCLDWYGPRTGSPVTDPFVSSPPSGDKARRVVRGASFLTPVNNARAASRYRLDPGSRNADTGFRLVVELATPKPVAAVAAPVVAPEPFRPEMPAPVMLDATDVPAGATTGGPRRMLGLLILGVPLAAGFGLIVYLLRSGRNDGLKRFPMTPARPPVSRAVEDGRRRTSGTDPRITLSQEGFWIASTAARPGARIRYRWMGNAGVSEGDLIFAPTAETSGHYVFTGATPVSAEIIAIADDSGNPFDTWAHDDSPPPLTSSTRDANERAIFGAGYLGGMLGSRASRSTRSSGWPSAY